MARHFLDVLNSIHSRKAPRALGFLAASVFGSVIISTFFLVPIAHAATVLTDQSVSISTSTTDNAYVFAGQAQVSAPLPDDLCAVAGTITVSAPIGGDGLLVGGTVDVQKPVAGDLRIIGGKVSVDDQVGGDLMVAGGAVTVSGQASSTYIVGGTVQMLNGSNGPVTIYGADVSLAGNFNGDVEVVSSDRVTIQDGTVIHGAFKYNAPQQATIPESASVTGGVNYIGSATWLPTAKQAKTFATAGIWVFILVRITAALVATGLIAGLFPLFTDRVVETSLRKKPESYILLTLLGFAGFIAIPVLILFLIVSFVGICIALIILAAYALFLLISYVYAAVLAGAMLMYIVRKNTNVSWRVAVLGVIVMYFLGIIPYIGLILKIVLCATAGGALLSLFYKFSFRRNELPSITD
jgi:hypothetical protein